VSKSLPLPDNVTVFPTDKPDTAFLKDLDVAVHGQGFAHREVREDLSASYPSPRSGSFNVGLLHTSADGRAGHEPYAPSSVAGLVSRGYDYWALGHVHESEILHERPWVVFPGNIQGRHIRETGPKGCLLVTVESGAVESVEQKPLDVMRWASCPVDAGGLENADLLLDRVETEIFRLLDEADGRPVAVRFYDLREFAGARRVRRPAATLDGAGSGTSQRR